MVCRTDTAHFSKACNFPGAAGQADTPLPSCQSPVSIAPLPAFSSSVPITFLPLCLLQGPFQSPDLFTFSQAQLVDSFHDQVHLHVTSPFRVSIPPCTGLAPFPASLHLPLTYPSGETAKKVRSCCLTTKKITSQSDYMGSNARHCSASALSLASKETSFPHRH